MGIASLGGILTGTGDVKSPNIRKVGGDYNQLIDAYLGSQDKILASEQKLRPQYDALNTQSLANLMPSLAGIFSSAAPGVASTVRGISPGQTSLLDALTQSAREQLNAGAALDPALARVTSQSIRGSQAARGLGYSPADVMQESSALTQLGNTLRNERQNFASGVAGMNNSFETQPSLQMLLAMMGEAGGLSNSAGSKLTPTSLSGNLLTMPYQGRLQANAATAANNTSLYQSMDSNSNSFISGL